MEYRFEHIKQAVVKELSCSAHNMEHIMRVYDMCIILSTDERSVDLEVLLPAALLHDIARVREDTDTSGQTDHSVLGAEMAGDILGKLGYAKDKIAKIQHCIIAHRFRSGYEAETIEAKILFDADKLDVLGAVGLARTYMMSGQYGQKLGFDPDSYSLKDNSDDNGRLREMSKHSPFVEYEIKYRKIPERLYTRKAKEIAVKRLGFMAEFFERLKTELEGLA